MGYEVRVVVTDTDAAGSAIEDSVSTKPIVALPSASGPAPVLSGSTKVGSRLSATTGTFSGGAVASYSYQWYDGTGSSDPIAGATVPSYTTASGDVGQSVHVAVTASNVAGSATEESASLGPIVAAPQSTALPVISGTARGGQVLTATTGSWSSAGSLSYAYQWERCDSEGSSCLAVGSGASTYALTSADV